MRRCYICNQLGHFQSACPHAGFSPGQIAQQQQGRGSQGQFAKGNFEHSQGPTNQEGFLRRTNPGQSSGRSIPRQQQGRGTQGGSHGRGNSSQPTFAQFTQWKQQQSQGRTQPPLTGTKRSSYEGNKPAAKRVAIKEPWPMKGPGTLQGSACVTMEAEVDDCQQHGYNEFQEFQEFLHYKANLSYGNTDDFVTNSSMLGYTEETYFPFDAEGDVDWGNQERS